MILSPGFPSDELDSTCLPMHQNFLLSLKENFPDIHFIVLAFQYPFFKKEYKWNGIDAISFNGLQKRKIFRLLLWRRILKKIKDISHQNKLIGFLSFWCNECALIGKYASRKYNCKHFCWILGQDAKPGNNYVKRINPTAEELVALSDFLQNEFEKNYSIRPAHVIPPGIRPQQFQEKIFTKDIDVLGAGSLIPLKRYDIFLEVINELKKGFPQIKAVLCGDGPEDHNLQVQLEKLKLKENVSFAGKINHQEVLQLMQRSKLFLHTSSYEGFGVVCIEALYAGAQVISFVKPMHENIPNWHRVNSKEEMITKCSGILRSPQMGNEPVLFRNMEDISKKFMHLFGYKETIIS